MHKLFHKKKAPPAKQETTRKKDNIAGPSKDTATKKEVIPNKSTAATGSTIQSKGDSATKKTTDSTIYDNLQIEENSTWNCCQCFKDNRINRTLPLYPQDFCKGTVNLQICKHWRCNDCGEERRNHDQELETAKQKAREEAWNESEEGQYSNYWADWEDDR